MNEGTLSKTRAAVYSINAKLPYWGQCVAVVTPYFQCRGFLDPGGEWYGTDGSVIKNVQSWYLMNADEVEFGNPLPT